MKQHDRNRIASRALLAGLLAACGLAGAQTTGAPGIGVGAGVRANTNTTTGVRTEAAGQRRPPVQTDPAAGMNVGTTPLGVLPTAPIGVGNTVPGGVVGGGTLGTIGNTVPGGVVGGTPSGAGNTVPGGVLGSGSGATGTPPGAVGVPR